MDLRFNRFKPRRQALKRDSLDSGSDQSPGPSSSFLSKLTELVEWSEENQCPYDPHHIIPQGDMYKHLEKCRGNYKYQLAKEGKEVMYSKCKYNSDHEIISPELQHHESICPEKNRHCSLLDMDQCQEKFDFKYDLWERHRDPEEIRHMYEGLHLDKIVDEAGFGSDVPLEQINNPAAMKEEKEAVEEAETKEIQKATEDAIELGATGESGPVEAVASNLPRRVRKKSYARAAEEASIEAPEVEESDDEDWGKSRKYPTFNLMEKLMNPSKPLFEYPPGLTKSQRKDFVKWNTQRINNLKESQEKEKERDNLHPVTTVFVDPEQLTRDVFLRNPEFEYH